MTIEMADVVVNGAGSCQKGRRITKQGHYAVAALKVGVKVEVVVRASSPVRDVAWKPPVITRLFSRGMPTGKRRRSLRETACMAGTIDKPGKSLPRRHAQQFVRGVR